MFLLLSLLFSYDFWMFVVAIAPAIVLLRYVYKQDKVEPEPTGLIIKLMIGGVLAALASMFLEWLGDEILGIFVNQSYRYYEMLEYFLVVAVSEESTKLFFCNKFTFHNKEFNYRFDGIVYTVATSLGFALFENILYVYEYGFGTGVFRALLSVPMHMCFAVFMGYFYGRARLADARGEVSKMKNEKLAGLLVAIIIHGIYDTACSFKDLEHTLFFLCFVVVVYIVIFNLIKKESKSDVPVEGTISTPIFFVRK